MRGAVPPHGALTVLGVDGEREVKISRLTTFMVPPRWLFLKIDTDDGICGWGEPVLEGRAAAVAAEVEELADYLIGKDPHRIEDHWTVLYRAGRFARYPANQSGSDGGAMQQVNA